MRWICIHPSFRLFSVVARIDRRGISRLTTAIKYIRAYTQSKMNAQIMARDQDIPVFEPETTSKSSKRVS
ncbi:DUF7437 domain-containing protein [Halalkalirubrum salinum]